MPIPFHTLRFRLLSAALLCAWSGLGGCSSLTDNDLSKKLIPESTESAKKQPSGVSKLEIAGQNLGESQEVSVSPGELLMTVNDLLHANRKMSAARWIERHPESTLEMLRQLGTIQGEPAAIAFIAAIHDRQSVRSAEGPTWTKLLAARRAQPAKFTKFDQARQQVVSMAKAGNIDAGLKLNLPSLAAECNERLIEIDAWQLQGTSLLLNEKPGEAVTAWQKALTIAQPISDYYSAYLMLLLSDAQRRTGDQQNASATWIRAVETAADLLGRPQPTYDPVLWERIAYLRPIQVQWPTDVVRRWIAYDTIPGLDRVPAAAVAEASLWNCIGKWYLDRGHHQAGLVSFKRAESSVIDPHSQHFLRFRQARALVLLDHAGAATAILISLAQDKSSPMARPSMALLGSMRLQSGKVQQGLNLLKNAIEKNETDEWAERADAEADLGLAYFMVGDEPKGAKWVHQAQHHFEARREYESLALSLQNEEGYLITAKKKAEAALVRQKLDALER